LPTYDYICTKCHHAWELEQRIVEDPVRKCPKCGANTAKRQISSGAGFILKGGGWYADGYGSKKPSSSESKADDNSVKAETKTEKKAEATTTESTKAESKDAGASTGATASEKKADKKGQKKAGAA
jgi:putative FmdB family regulatory protein